MDYSITFTQFCIAFVMLAGAGANLNQQWGLATWVGAAIMAVAVVAVSLLDVDKVTTILGSITPLIIAVLLVAVISTGIHPPTDFASAARFAIDNVSTTLPSWWVSTLNYIGIALMGGISMGIVMGGDLIDVRVAGRGGVFGGLLFGIMLLLMVVTMSFNVADVYTEPLPTLAIINSVHPWLGYFASVVIYLMIFSTALGNFYSLGKRLTVSRPSRFPVVLAVLVGIGFALSFLDFATLVGAVFPIMGYVALVMIAVLLVSWLGRGRGIVNAESRRRDKVRALVLRMVDPNEKFTGAHRAELAREIFRSNIENQHLRATILAEVVEELDADDCNDFSATTSTSTATGSKGRTLPSSPARSALLMNPSPLPRARSPASPNLSTTTPNRSSSTTKAGESSRSRIWSAAGADDILSCVSARGLGARYRRDVIHASLR